MTFSASKEKSKRRKLKGVRRIPLGIKGDLYFRRGHSCVIIKSLFRMKNTQSIADHISFALLHFKGKQKRKCVNLIFAGNVGDGKNGSRTRTLLYPNCDLSQFVTFPDSFFHLLYFSTPFFFSDCHI